MKREIKFRAKIKAKDFRVKLAMAGKPKNEGEWTYGEVHLQSTIPHIHEGMDKYPIDVDTVGQFTGMKDKNGKEIYEGDILGCANPKIKHLVFYNERQGRFMAALNGNLDDDFWLCGFDSGRWNASKEIIGNIYDNPEILTEKWRGMDDEN